MFRSSFVLVFVLLIKVNANAQNYNIGDEVPQFKLWLTDGSRLTKNDILNKVVVFKFWFIGCLPCRADITELNELVEVYKNHKNLLFVAPALDRKDSIEQFVSHSPFHFKLAYSAMDVSLLLNKHQAYPFYYVIQNGKFIYVDKPEKASQILGIKKVLNQALQK